MRSTRRLVLLLAALLGTVVVVASGVALAAVITGGPGDNTIRGTEYADTLNGNDGNDAIYGLAGNDEVDGGNNIDWLYGGNEARTLSGDDRVLGRAGNDRVVGGPGADVLHGGVGDDAVFAGPSGDASVDRIYGYDGNDRVYAVDLTATADVIDCGVGRDEVHADEADQVSSNCEVVGRTIRGTAGEDTAQGENGSDDISGMGGNDTITGGEGADTLSGDDGDDTITAVDGQQDAVSCGPGYDRVRVDPADTGSAECESVLTVSSDTPTEVAGSYDQEGYASAVTFDSDAVSGEVVPETAPGAEVYDKEVALSASAGGDTLNIGLDPQTWTVTQRAASGTAGSDVELSVEDQGAMLDAAKETSALLDSEAQPVQNEEALLVGMLTYLSEAPEGHVFHDDVFQESAPTVAPADEPATMTNASFSAASDSGAGGADGGCRSPAHEETSHSPLGLSSGAQTVFVNHLCDNNTDNDGIWVLRCAPEKHGAWHDAPCVTNNSHGFVYNYVQSGPGDHNPINGYQSGGCGPGYFHGGFAQDCLDHDICAFDHLYSAGFLRIDRACGDEYEAAIGDFSYVNSHQNVYCRLSDSRALGGPSVPAAERNYAPPTGPSTEGPMRRYITSLVRA